MKNLLLSGGKDRWKIFILPVLFLFLFSISLTSAVPPVQSTLIPQDRGVDIVHPETPYSKLGNDLEFNFWTYNSTNGATLTNSTLNCTLYIINDRGVQYYRFSNLAGANGLIKYGKGAPLCVNCWTMTLPAQNISTGLYSYQIKCQANVTTATAVGGYVTGYFEIIEGSQGGSDTNNFYWILILLTWGVAFVGFFGKNIWVTVFGGMGMMMFGIYILTKGITIYENWLTQGISYFSLGLGAFFMIYSLVEWLGDMD